MQNGIRLRRVLSLMRSKYKNNLESLMIKNVTEGGKNGVKKNFKVNLFKKKKTQRNSFNAQ